MVIIMVMLNTCIYSTQTPHSVIKLACALAFLKVLSLVNYVNGPINNLCIRVGQACGITLAVIMGVTGSEATWWVGLHGWPHMGSC